MNAALEGSFTVNGVEAKPGFQLVKEAVKDFSPEWAEEITTIPAETIRRITAEFIGHAHIGETIQIGDMPMPFSPTGIQYQRGAYQHTINGVRGDLVARTLNELAGAIDVPGGINGMMYPNPYWPSPDQDGILAPKGEAVPEEWVWPPESLTQRQFYPVCHTLAHIGARAILAPEEYHMEYEPEIILSYGGNPIHAMFNQDIWEEVYAKVPFSVTVALVYDEVALMSDILLPEHSFMERDYYEWNVHQDGAGQGVMTDTNHLLSIFGRREAGAITEFL